MNLIEKVLLLQKLDLFSHVTSEQLSFIAAIAREVSVPGEHVFYNEGDPSDGLYVLVAGKIRLTRDGAAIEHIGADGSFGGWALLDEEVRITGAVSDTDSRLLFIAREDFYDVLSDHVDIVQRIFKHLVQRVRRLAAMTS